MRNYLFSLVLALLLVPQPALVPPLHADSDAVLRIPVADNTLLFELVGQVTNFTPTSSTQYGYFTYVGGLSSLFVGSAENESSARFTFYREATNIRVSANGPLRTFLREGTTTIFYNDAPSGSFADPDTFRSGTPIAVATVQQQVVVDTVSLVFTVVNIETITSTNTFSHDGSMYRIGKVGDVYRTTKQGRLNTPAPPNGYFSGYSVGASR